MKKQKIVYIMDPHCAWTYGTIRVISDLKSVLEDEFVFEILPGGMWTNEYSIRGGKAIKDFLLPDIIRLNEFSDAGISKAYIDLIQDSTYLLRSDLPSQAIIAVKTLFPEKSFEFAHNLMRKQFDEGSRYDIEKTYLDVIESMDLNVLLFKNYWKSSKNIELTKDAFKQASEYTQSYPSLVKHYDSGHEVFGRGSFSHTDIFNTMKEHNV